MYPTRKVGQMIKKETTQLDKGVRTSLKKALGDDYQYLKIGYDYYYKGNAVTIIPIEIGKHYYATIQAQGSNYKININQMSKNSHMSVFNSGYEELHTDNLEDLALLFKDYLDNVIL